jgi:2-keto-4-pentenoate hydratase/2-oxohepta-3-ene-1,7-dioic acid hydratase in catechol pathway
MRFANHDGRLTLISAGPDDDLDGATGIDMHEASGGRIPADPELALQTWGEVLTYARAPERTERVALRRGGLASPSPRPRQIFGIGVNYADHGAESGMEVPDVPLVFPKLSTAVAGPFDAIPLSTETVDWEVEIAVVIGTPARHVPEARAWDVVAGLTVGQDLSDRDIQWRPKSVPQFSLGKSLAGFAPLGPVLVTPDEFADRDDIELSCRLNGEEMQRSRSSKMILPVGALIAYLSSVVELVPGDVIFTGTPSGIGMSRTPPRYLSPGDRLESWIEGVGSMSHTFVGAPAVRETVSSNRGTEMREGSP